MNEVIYGSYIINFWVVFDSRIDFFIFFLVSLFSFYLLNCLSIIFGDVSSTILSLCFLWFHLKPITFLKNMLGDKGANSATFSVTSLLPSAASVVSSGRETLGIRFLRRPLAITKKYRLVTHNAWLKHKLAPLYLSRSPTVLWLLLLTGQWDLKFNLYKTEFIISLS